MGYGVFSRSCTFCVFKIRTAANVVLLFFEKTFYNTICFISLQRLRRLARFVSSMDGRFLSILREHLTLPGIPFFAFIFTEPSPSFPSRFLITSFISIYCSLSLSTSSISFNFFYPTVWGWDQPRLLHSFLNTLQNEELHVHFPGRKYNLVEFLWWLWESTDDKAKELVAVMQYKASERMQIAVLSAFYCTDYAVRREIRTQPIRQLLRALIVCTGYASKYSRIKKLMMFVFCDHMVALKSVSSRRFLQLIAESNRRITESLFRENDHPNCLWSYYFPLLPVGLRRRFKEDDAKNASRWRCRYADGLPCAGRTQGLYEAV